MTADPTLATLRERLEEAYAELATLRAEKSRVSQALDAALTIVKRTARMGLCSQTHHEHLMYAARAALDEPSADEASER